MTIQPQKLPADEPQGALESVATDVLCDRCADDDAVDLTMVNEGNKGGAGDGMESDAAGNIYATSKELRGIEASALEDTMKILMVLTPHDQLGDTGKKTGFWLEEYEAFVSDRDAAFGVVREILPNGRPELVVYVENAGDFIVPLDAVAAVHAQKVILNCDRLDSRFREAIDHAHDAETRY
jgi:hypothetical protein